jgi:phosphoglucomutase
MVISNLAGEPVDPSPPINVPRLVTAYYTCTGKDPGDHYQALTAEFKMLTENGWFAARPSGTENIYKIYAESFKDQGHLDAIVNEAQEIVNHALESFDSAYQQREANE